MTPGPTGHDGPDATAVALARSAAPTALAVDRAVEEVLGLVGDPLDALGRGDRVVIKPNMFQRQRDFHTNADLLVALARRAAARGARVFVAERTRALLEILRDSPVHRYAEVVSFDDRPLRIVQIPAATSLRVPIAVPDLVTDCDLFVGAPQLRTHSSVVFTNAMKNLVGLLPGFTTRIVHMAGVEESIVDLNLLRPQHLVVSDATTVIEGNYPMAGRSRRVGVVAASRNAVALDTVTAAMAGIDPSELAYLQDAGRRGLGPADLGSLAIRGEELADVSFRIERGPVDLTPPRAGIHVHAETACPDCRRWIAAALGRLRSELLAYEGEMTIISGPRTELPALRGAVVLVGNATYEHREAGVYLEGCPPRAIQVAGFRQAMGLPASEAELSQSRLPVAGVDPAWPRLEECV
ncbi:DUF362 domain-containing protein [Actinacidiphila rubida]|uniref:Uncharacterized conserved protein, DUF362 family n=1 Tax=Actinacidiphila rubida TaxID=310780 RepID=A0A1H8EHV1_9ACTN|nr:DUF362 domain-containing protein [Actinacidiphila rubida]SEN19065.1 Uncharacterized conserved protein, DUF362 family [Actinacidiphila rubida]